MFTNTVFIIDFNKGKPTSTLNIKKVLAKCTITICSRGGFVNQKSAASKFTFIFTVLMNNRLMSRVLFSFKMASLTTVRNLHLHD